MCSHWLSIPPSSVGNYSPLEGHFRPGREGMSQKSSPWTKADAVGGQPRLRKEGLPDLKRSNRSLLGVVEKAPLTRGVGGFMARKDGGESEGIVLYPSRSPSLGWKPTPLAPLVRGVKAMRPTRGFSTTPSRSRLTPTGSLSGLRPYLTDNPSFFNRQSLLPQSRLTLKGGVFSDVIPGEGAEVRASSSALRRGGVDPEAHI